MLAARQLLLSLAAPLGGLLKAEDLALVRHMGVVAHCFEETEIYELEGSDIEIENEFQNYNSIDSNILSRVRRDFKYKDPYNVKTKDPLKVFVVLGAIIVGAMILWLAYVLLSAG